MNFPLRQRLLTSLVVIAAILVFASGDERKEGCSGVADKASEQGLQGETSEQNAEEKRKWGDKNMRVWGKREDWEKEDSDKRDWSKNNMRAWGKRDATEEEKRSWSKQGLRAWGKREDEGEEEKRKWGDNKVRVWGKRDPEDEKRAWDKNNLRAWGKRDWDKTELEGEDETAKRTWSNRVRAWGKRSDDDVNHDEKASLKTEAKMADHSSTEQRSAIVKRAIESRVKRSWNSNMGAFKTGMDYYPPGGPKRSWRTNVIRVWGKRNVL